MIGIFPQNNAVNNEFALLIAVQIEYLFFKNGNNCEAVGGWNCVDPGSKIMLFPDVEAYKT